MSTTTDTETDDSTEAEDTLEPVEGFDPASDKARGMGQARIKSTYEELLERGEDEMAEKLRRTPATHEQKRLVKNIQDFDPKHNQATNTGRLRVKRTYEALLELAEESSDEDDESGVEAREAAQELRESQSLGKQRKKVRQFKDEFDISVI